MEVDDVHCEACGWQGSLHGEDGCDYEYDGSGVTWWCPNCDAQWSLDED